MEQAARAAGIADTHADPEASPTRDVEASPYARSIGARSPYSQGGNASRVSLPLSHRRSFSTTGAASTSTRHHHDASRHRRPSSSASHARARRRRDRATTGGRPAHAPPPAAPIGTAHTTAEPDRPPPLDAGAEQDQEQEHEIPWGPAHPCFPHANPHVPLASPQYSSTRVIRIARDWTRTGDVAPAFSTLYPEILDFFPCLGEGAFTALIGGVNARLAAAFAPTGARAVADALLGVATGWLWDDAGLGWAKRGMRAVEAWIDRWNRDHGAADGVWVVPLRRTAYLSLDIVIPDPKIVSAAEADAEDVDGAEGDEGELRDGDAEAEGDDADDAGSRTATMASASSAGAAAAAAGRGGGGGAGRAAPPVVPPIPSEFLQESAALQVTMQGFRDSRES